MSLPHHPAERSPLHLADLAEPARAAREGGAGLHTFLSNETVLRLKHWPDDVIHQWLYDHSGSGALQLDYGHVDLTSILWSVEVVALDDFLTMPTGDTEATVIDHFARDPEHWVSVRNRGQHLGVKEMWDVHGTWKRWPILLDRSVIAEDSRGLQVVEGRTRVGVLRGRARLGLHVASEHLAWVGRAISGPECESS